MCAVLVIASALAIAPTANAHPRAGSFGPGIDPFPSYEGQSRCDPAPKPGVLAFQRMVLSAYPVTNAGSISRACNVGGKSEHKEGRAWDWGAAYANVAQRRAADDMIAWLEAPDHFGNDAAMARRFGVMYVIWNRHIWFPGYGWRVYCKQKGAVCVSPESHSVMDPHVSHVHISFTWDGAYRRTTAYRPGTTFVDGIAAAPYGGYWLVTKGGGVLPYGSSAFGSMNATSSKGSVRGIVPTPDSSGYWLYTSDGHVKAFGSARFLGARKDQHVGIAAMAPLPKGGGYWLASRTGRVFAYGRAKALGGLNNSAPSAPIVGMDVTPTGLGYRLFASDGSVYPFGDALPVDAADSATDVVGGVVRGSDGFWEVTSQGRVIPGGSAPSFGGLGDKPLGSTIVGIDATSDGGGYWLVDSLGRVWAFGDARNAGYPGSHAPAEARAISRVPSSIQD
ncbi:MAG: hypothetical protein ABR579_01525 [Actinomycetota bacterium]